MHAQTFLLVADTGSSALAVVGDPKLGCLHHLDTSDRCDTGRHVECLYGSGGWRGVDCHRDVATQASCVPLPALPRQLGPTTG